MELQKSRFGRYCLLSVLFLFFSINFIDRHLVAVLSPEIKLDLELSDTQLGVLKGFAFILVYSLVSLPIARLADRFSYLNVLGGSVFFSSLMTSLCGLAGSFSQFFTTRFLFGVGSPGCTPAAHALIANHFANHERSRAVAIYTLGVPLGTMAAFTLGGWLRTELGWRNTFFAFGMLGMAASLLRFLFKEPYRPQRSMSRENFSLLNTIRLLLTNRQFLALTLACIFGSYSVTGVSAWTLDLLVRTNRWPYAYISLVLGLCFGIFGSLGMFFGAWLADRGGKKEFRKLLKVPGCCLLLGAPLYGLSLWFAGGVISLVFFVVTIFLIFSFQGPAFSYALSVAPVHNRAMTSSLLLIFMNIGGTGFGPLAIGMVSDAALVTFDEGMALRVGMTTICLALVAAGLLFLRICYAASETVESG